MDRPGRSESSKREPRKENVKGQFVSDRVFRTGTEDAKLHWTRSWRRKEGKGVGEIWLFRPLTSSLDPNLMRCWSANLKEQGNASVRAKVR